MAPADTHGTTTLKLMTIYSLIMHGIKGLAHCYRLLIQNTDNKLANVPGKGGRNAAYQLGLFSGEGVHEKGQRIVWFCPLWVVLVSFVPADLITRPALLSYQNLVAHVLISNVSNHSIVMESNRLSAVSDMFVFVLFFYCICVYILILLLYVVAAQITSGLLLFYQLEQIWIVACR